ncbi:MAG: hypothetical protein K2I71_06085 [Helicobacter sp.]|nr:hypothetical protein [Helicobacter sp.]
MSEKILFDKVDNIPLFLQQKEEELAVKLDFNLLDTQTVCIMDDNTPKLVPDTRIFNKDSNFIADMEIKQFHTIEIYETPDTEKEFYFELQDDSKFNLMATLACCSSLVFHSNLKADILHLLYKTMLLNGYLIKIREYKNLSLQINEFIKQVIDGIYPVKVLFNVAVGVVPTSTKEGRLNFCFDKENFAFSNIPRTIQQKNFLTSFKMGDLLLEYIKPIPSRAGRNLKGEKIVLNEKVSYCPVRVKTGIRCKEDETTIKFFAAQDGFLKEIGPYTFVISDNLLLSDSFDGIEQVSADKMVKINGVVDSKSHIQADICFIAIHQGDVKAHTVVIDSLEKGRVEARVAFINASMSGIIKADYVYIKEMRSSNKIYTRYSLVIDNIIGDFNILEVDPENFVFLRRDRMSYIRLVDEMRKKMRFFRQKMTNLRNYLFTSQSKAYAVKNQDPNKPASKGPGDIVKQREKSLEEYKESLKEYYSLANLWYIGEKKLKDINEAAFNARVIIRRSSQGQESLLKFKAYEHEVENLYNIIVPKVNNAITFKVVKEGGIGDLRQIDGIETEDIQWINKLSPYPPNNKARKK